jgi:ABC-type glycerol-3-phosphate transport system permease component
VLIWGVTVVSAVAYVLARFEFPGNRVLYYVGGMVFPVFLGMWNEYLLPLVLNTDEKRYLVTRGLATIAVTQGYHSDFSGLFAGLTISILPVLGVYLVFHKQISTGMTAGALK